MKAFLLVSLALTSVFTSGCGFILHEPLDVSRAPVPSPASKVDHKALTVLVIAEPAPALRRTFEGIAAKSNDENVAALFKGHSQGGFGSGAYIIRDPEGRRVPYVVTNRHVVADSSSVEVQFSDGMTYRNCPVVFENPSEDLAVIELPQSVLKVHPFGYTIAMTQPAEREMVIASGFPGINGQPSYQLTEGKVSNAAFSLLNDAGSRTALIQHTAPIDPGSSGGPLVDERGELVGINVAIVRGRQSLNLSVPARAVDATLRLAAEANGSQSSPQLAAQALDRACQRLGAELATSDMNVKEAVSYVSNEFAGNEGLPSFLGAIRITKNASLARMIENDPTQGMRAGILMRLKATAQLQGVSGECTPANPSDLANLGSASTIRMNLRAARGTMELRWVFEHGNWRVASGKLIDLNAIADAVDVEKAKEDTKAAKAKGTVKKTSSR
jgi:S1-C subfamily serine protease